MGASHATKRNALLFQNLNAKSARNSKKNVDHAVKLLSATALKVTNVFQTLLTHHLVKTVQLLVEKRNYQQTKTVAHATSVLTLNHQLVKIHAVRLCLLRSKDRLVRRGLA